VILLVGDRVKFTRIALAKKVSARMKNPKSARGTCVGHKHMAETLIVLVRWDREEHREHAYSSDYIEKA
jgi:hypothetical protein